MEYGVKCLEVMLGTGSHGAIAQGCSAHPGQGIHPEVWKLLLNPTDIIS